MYLRNLGIAIDRALNCLFLAGSPDETVSVHAAKSQSRWACYLCKWLSWTVERDHCTKTLDNAPTKDSASLKALAQMIIVIVGLYLASLVIWI